MKSVLVESGPLVVIVDAISWQDYLGGIIQHHCSSHNANHAVLITGYDTTGTHTHRHGQLNTLYLCLGAYKGSERWPSRITSCQGHKIEPTLANTGCAPTSQKTA